MKNTFPKTLILLTCISILSTSCFKNFYQTDSKKAFTKLDAEIVNSDPNKYVIIHFSDQIMELSKYSITNDSIKGEINKLDIPEHMLYLHPKENSSNSYKKRFESAVLNEVHIYTSQSSPSKESNYLQIASKDITRIDMYQKDMNRTISNHVLSSLGLIGGLVGLTYLILIISPLSFSIGPVI